MRKEDVSRELPCPDCDDVSRRHFLRSAATAATAVGTAGLSFGAAGKLLADDAKAKKVQPAETVVKQLFDSLKDNQRKLVCMPFDHAKRSMINNNWFIVDPKAASIGKLYNADQQEMILQIFKGVTSEDGYKRFEKQMKDDAGGFDKYTCAIFGEPGTGKFEWVLTGRHLTIRADGDSVENTAFGGPIFYGHAAGGFNEKPDHAGNVWWHQARLANKLYSALDGKQRDKALVVESPPDSPKVVRLKGTKGKLEGLRGADMSKDQKKLLDETLRSMLNMYRKSDVDEALKCIDANGGLDALTVSYFDEGNIGDDEIWDRWMVEGPGMVWYFRGTPHVHTWVNIAGKQA